MDEQGRSRRLPVAPLTGGWKGMGEHEHFVEFYRDDELLADSVCGFLGGGLIAGAACIVIATPAHRRRIVDRLAHRGFDMADAIDSGQYVALDAAETLARFMVGGVPDGALFDATIGPVIARAELYYPRVLAFGEMVALLAEDGSHAAAVELEKLWNILARRHAFSLFCAYPTHVFADAEAADAFKHVCAEHSGVIHATQ